MSGKPKAEDGHFSEINSLRVFDGKTVIDHQTGQTLKVYVPSGFSLEVVDALAAETLAGMGSIKDGSPRWYAALISKQVLEVRAALARNDVETIMAIVYELGRLTAEAEMVRKHGSAHLTGSKQRKVLAENTKRNNAARRTRATVEHERWVAAARAIWERRPFLTVSACAESVIQKLELSVSRKRTVRRVITPHNPQKVGHPG